MLTITIDRTGLALDPLIIGDSPDGSGVGLWIPAGGYVSPDFTARLTYAPDSAYVAGRALLAATLEAATLPLVIIVEGSSQADMAARKAELAAALFQFSYTVTVDLDGNSETWSADPTYPQWGEISHAWASRFMGRAVVTIPINPAGS